MGGCNSMVWDWLILVNESSSRMSVEAPGHRLLWYSPGEFLNSSLCLDSVCILAAVTRLILRDLMNRWFGSWMCLTSLCLSRVLSYVLGSKTEFSKMFWLATLLACPAFAWANSILMRPGRATVVTLVWPICFWWGFSFGGGHPWSWWSQLIVLGKVTFGYYWLVFQLLLKLWLLSTVCSVWELLLNGQTFADVLSGSSGWCLTFYSLSRSENSQWAACFLNRVANWSTVPPAFWTACRNWKTT